MSEDPFLLDLPLAAFQRAVFHAQMAVLQTVADAHIARYRMEIQCQSAREEAKAVMRRFEAQSRT